MKTRKLVDLPYVIGLMVLPLSLAALFLLVAWIIGMTRYNPAFFSEDYQERYAVPSPLLADMENALRNGDGGLMAQLQGTRQVPSNLEKLPNTRFLIFWDKHGKYTDYLYMDMKNYHRYLQHLRMVNGRYVRVPDGAYYLADSGRWKTTFGPLAVVYWLLVILFTLGVWIYRSMSAYREKVFGKPPGVAWENPTDRQRQEGETSPK